MSYLVSENCEGGVTPSGWTDVPGGGETIAWNYSPALNGNYSLEITGTTNASTTKKSFAATDPIYGFFKYSSNNLSQDIFRLMDGSGNQIISIYINASDNFAIWDDDSSSAYDSGFITSTYTPYYVWFEYHKSGLVKLYVSSTATKPGVAQISYTTGNAATVAQVWPYAYLAINIFDDIYISTSDITGDPSAVSASAALTGTATSSITEAEVVTGGKTIIITLTGDTWIAS